MLKISDALASVINVNDFVKAGLSHRLFNLSQLSKYLKPLIEARLKKDVQDSAILMNLSRIQRDFEKSHNFQNKFLVDKISIQANLFTATFVKSPNIHKEVNQFYQWIQKYKGFISISESSKELTLITELSFLERMPEIIKQKPVFLKTNINGIGVQMNPDYIKAPGFLYLVLQKIALQGVNVVEVCSTYTEFMIFVDHDETKLSFDTLYLCFKGF